MKRKNKIALNAVMYAQSLGGAATYIHNLVKGALYSADPALDIKVYASEYLRSQFLNTSNSIYPAHIPSHRFSRLANELFYWPTVLKKHAIDLFHSPISYIPPGVHIPSIVTIHDLRVFHDPHSYKKLRRRFLEKMIPRSAQKAVNIIAVSDYTKQDIIQTLGIPDNKITVIYEGIDTSRYRRTYSLKDIAKLIKKYNLPNRYILTVGHLEPRKNYLRLLEAFALLKHEHHIPHILVITGQENWHYQNIYRRVSELKLKNHVRFTGYFPDEDLAFLYQNADVYVQPSLFEGFGLTPLESMAAGTPVAVSNCTSHPEICGDAALYFDPYNVIDMADKILQSLADNTQSVLKRASEKQLSKYSWSACCEQTFELYKTCVGQM